MVNAFSVLATLDQLVEAARGAVMRASVGLGERGHQLWWSAVCAGRAAFQARGCLT